MTWQLIGGICAALIPALTLIDIVRLAIDERRHPRQGDDQAMYH